jgi:hypothetical protein
MFAHIGFWSDPDTQDVRTGEKAINLRYSRDFWDIGHQRMVSDLRQLPDLYQIRHDFKRSRSSAGNIVLDIFNIFPHPQESVTAILVLPVMHKR